MIIPHRGKVKPAPRSNSVTIVSSRKDPGRIGSLTLDATLDDSHEFSNEVTSFPIEEGSDINDHIKKEPMSLSITGFITNSPVTIIESLTLLIVSDTATVENTPVNREDVSRNNVAGGFTELMNIVGDNYPEQPSSATVVINRPKVIEVVTGLRVYSDMVMTRLSIKRTPSDGESLTFTASFRKIVKVKRELVNLGDVKSSYGNAGNSATPTIEDDAEGTLDSGDQNSKRLKSLAVRLGESNLSKNIIDKIEALVGGIF
jgi:hypothetical protein